VFLEVVRCGSFRSAAERLDLSINVVRRRIDDFERRGWLSEARVVEQVLATRRRRFGSQRITHELREKGISEAAIGGAQEHLKESEIEAARAVWQRKFKTPPADARERARHMRFLQGRGFSLDTILRLLRDADD